jgi:hypothetical protein
MYIEANKIWVELNWKAWKSTLKQVNAAVIQASKAVPLKSQW